MSDSIVPGGSFYDFSGLADLRARASKQAGSDTETRQRVAAEFESAFMQLMLQSMKKASEPLKSDLLQSQSTEFVEDMFITEVSHFIAMRQSLGVGKWIDSTMEKTGIVPASKPHAADLSAENG
ncbi:MAG: hypothetical protein ACE37N_05905 [Pseudohongiellaceae bacterium]|jgi:flagellar protein FlgJ